MKPPLPGPPPRAVHPGQTEIGWNFSLLQSMGPPASILSFLPPQFMFLPLSRKTLFLGAPSGEISPRQPDIGSGHLPFRNVSSPVLIFALPSPLLAFLPLAQNTLLPGSPRTIPPRQLYISWRCSLPLGTNSPALIFGFPLLESAFLLLTRNTSFYPDTQCSPVAIGYRR